MQVRASVLYTISLALVHAVKSCASVLNNTVVTRHSNSTWPTHVKFCEYLRGSFIVLLLNIGARNCLSRSLYILLFSFFVFQVLKKSDEIIAVGYYTFVFSSIEDIL